VNVWLLGQEKEQRHVLDFELSSSSTYVCSFSYAITDQCFTFLTIGVEGISLPSPRIKCHNFTPHFTLQFRSTERTLAALQRNDSSIPTYADLWINLVPRSVLLSIHWYCQLLIYRAFDISCSKLYKVIKIRCFVDFPRTIEFWSSSYKVSRSSTSELSFCSVPYCLFEHEQQINTKLFIYLYWLYTHYSLRVIIITPLYFDINIYVQIRY